MARQDRNAFRRLRCEIEEKVLVNGQTSTEVEARGALSELARKAGPPAQEQFEDLVDVIAGRKSASGYKDEYGICGVRRFETATGRVIYMMPIETFPDHVNNVYVIRDDQRVFLLDAGTALTSAQDDFARAARVLAKVYDESGLLDRVTDVVISHGHIDHFGGVGGWKEKGARVLVHEFDARVIASFDERIAVTSRAIRQFLQASGVGDDERRDLHEMYMQSKNAFRAVPVDEVLVDGQVIFDCIAHHVPGHCPGQICLQVDNILLTADHVLPRITPNQSPEWITQSMGLDHYFESLEKIRNVSGVDIALPGHETPIARLSQRVVEIEKFHRERLEKTRKVCSKEAKNIFQIAHELFGAQQGYGRILAYTEAGAHVEFLQRRGQLEIANIEDFEHQDNPVVLYRSP